MSLIRTLVTGVAIFIVSVILMNSITYASVKSELLSERDIKLIEEYVSTVRVRDAVGQVFMVGIPYDYLNYKERLYKITLEKLFSDLGVGFVIMHGYNYYQIDEYPNHFRKKFVRTYHEALQYYATNERYQIPLIISGDFEGRKWNSFQYILNPPPDALTLGATQDPDLIYDVADAASSQLLEIGAHMLLGPVLDPDMSTQGIYNSSLETRSFGHTKEAVINIASHYIAGVKDNGVLTIGKHFPGVGFIDNNPHYSEQSNFVGTKKQFEENLDIFGALALDLDGVMTSHVTVPAIEEDSKTPATLSKTIVEYHLRKRGLIKGGSDQVDSKLIISDDLSQMKSILSYMNGSETTPGDIAIKVFEAGHDVLMFAHLNDHRIELQTSASNPLTIEEFESVVEQLRFRIEQDSALEKRFRESLKRVLVAKAKVAKSIYGMDVSDMLRKGGGIKIKGETWPAVDDGKVEKIYGKAVRKAFSSLNGSIPDIAAAPQKLSCFYVKERYVDLFRKAFEIVLNGAYFYGLPKKRTPAIGREIREDLRSNYNGCDYIIYTVFAKDDYDNIDWLRLNGYNLNKLVILMHNNPLFLKSENVSLPVIAGSFTDHPISYQVDVEALKGQVSPSGRLTVPFNQQPEEITISRRLTSSAAEFGKQEKNAIYGDRGERKTCCDNLLCFVGGALCEIGSKYSKWLGTVEVTYVGAGFGSILLFFVVYLLQGKFDLSSGFVVGVYLLSGVLELLTVYFDFLGVIDQAISQAASDYSVGVGSGVLDYLISAIINNVPYRMVWISLFLHTFLFVIVLLLYRFIVRLLLNPAKLS